MNYYVSILSVALSVSLMFEVGESKSQVAICPESPAPLYDETMELLLHSDHPSKFAKETKSPTERTTFDRADSKCPSEGFSKIKESSLKRTCPSHFVFNFDSNRIPMIVFEAKCKCRECLSRTGTTGDTCRPVYYFRHVLQRDPKKEKKCYHHVVKAFSVGCHCIGRTTKYPESPKAIN